MNADAIVTLADELERAVERARADGLTDHEIAAELARLSRQMKDPR